LPRFRLSLLAACILPAFMACSGPTMAGGSIPSFFDPHHAPPKPDLSRIRQIRFLTEDDFPPFNFLVSDGQLAGFNIDLARAICAELDLSCTVQRRSWELLVPALDDNSGDAVIAALAINDDTRKRAVFTAPYFLTPGRFVMIKDTTLSAATPEAIEDRKVAVVAGSRHEAFLKTFYPRAELVAFATPAEARSSARAWASPSRKAMSRCGARWTMRWPGSTGAARWASSISNISRSDRFRPLSVYQIRALRSEQLCNRRARSLYVNDESVTETRLGLVAMTQRRFIGLRRSRDGKGADRPGGALEHMRELQPRSRIAGTARIGESNRQMRRLTLKKR
jgi:hypothetical protein